MDQTKSYFKTLPMNKFLSADYFWGVVSAIGGWTASFVAPTIPFISMVVVLVLTDLLTGTRAARERGEAIHSRGLRRTVEKIVLYFAAILLAEGMKYVFVPMIPVTYVVAFSIAVTEFRSNVENIETVTGVRIWNAIKSKLKF